MSEEISGRIDYIRDSLPCHCTEGDLRDETWNGDTGQQRDCPHHGDGDPRNTIAAMLTTGWTLSWSTGVTP